MIGKKLGRGEMSLVLALRANVAIRVLQEMLRARPGLPLGSFLGRGTSSAVFSWWGAHSLPSALGLVGTYAAGVLVGVAGAQHVLRDPTRSRASIAPPAPLVGPDFHVHLHQARRLAAPLRQGSPPCHRDLLPLEVLPGIARQADVLDVVCRPHWLVKGQDGNIIPLRQGNLENKRQ